MLETKYLALVFTVLLIAVGITGEVSGFRALVCFRNSQAFVRRLVLVIGLYLAVSLLLGLILIRLILLSDPK